MFLQSQLEKAFHSIILDVANELQCSVSFKNVPFKPKADKPYLRASILVGEKYSVTLGESGHLEFKGFYQVDIRTPKGQGTEFQNKAIDLLNVAFKIGLHLQTPIDHMLKLTSNTYNTGGQTTVSDATRGAIENEWDVTYFTVNWLAREPKLMR